MTGSDPGAPDSTWTYGDSRFWAWLAFGLGAIAFGKGIREPNLWSYTQAQLDYSDGFTRRGLFGSLLKSSLGLNHYLHFMVLSTALLFVLYCLFALLARASGLMERTPPGELLAVYASSYSVTYLAHLNGYLDIPLALLCIGPLFVRSTGWRLVVASVCAVVGILIHEQFFFAFLPLLAVSIAFGAVTAKTESERRLAWIGSTLLAVMGLGLVVCLGRYASISEVQTQHLMQSIAKTADRPISEEVLQVLPRTPHENLQIMEWVWSRPTYLPAQVESLLIFGPTAVVLLWATLVLLRRWMPGRYRWPFAGVLLATLAPLSLHLVGWDKNRWNELLCLNAFLMLLMVTRLLGGEPVQLPVRLRRACMLVMLLNMATGGGMLDGRHTRSFPFLRDPDAAMMSATASHPQVIGSSEEAAP